MGLKILTWNLSFAYGLGSDGTAYTPRPVEHFESALQSMAAVIENTQADIVLLQEVDFKSSRSHDRDQLGELARMSNRLYHQRAVSWDSPYVPFPGLNPSHQFGRILSGGGVLSRFPIRNIQIDLLPKPRENGRIYNFFYLNRYLQMVEIEGYKLCNLHLEAFSRDNRELQWVKLQDRILDFDLDVAAGDFNGTGVLSDSIQKTWSTHFAPEPTFPSPNPNEYLDGFILKTNRFKNIKVSTLNTGTVSDHFPVLLEVD